MSENDSSTPGTRADQDLQGSSGDDALSGAHGSDTITTGAGDDTISGDGPVPGNWLYSLYERDFTSASGQAFDIESGALLNEGYVTDFDVDGLARTLQGTGQDPNDFGVIYQSTLEVQTGGTYRFDLTSDDGSTIRILDGNGDPVEFTNQNGSTGDFLDNDYHQGPTTRWGEVDLQSGESYEIEIRYWENGGGEALDVDVTGPDTGGVTIPLLGAEMVGLPPDPGQTTAPNPYESGDWSFRIYDHDFSGSDGQAFDIETGTEIGSGYANDLDVQALALAARGTTGNPSDYGIVYQSTLSVAAGGSYSFSTRSDDGSTLRIFDENGVPVQVTNQDGAVLDYLDNDYHQGATTRTGTVELQAGEAYTIEVRYWENAGSEALEVEMSGPDTGGTWEPVADQPGFGNPPTVPVTVGVTDPGVPGDDVLDAGAGSDVITTGGGSDFVTGSSFGGGAGVTDTITDFDGELDIADLSAFFPTMADLRAATEIVDGNAVVTLPDGAQVVFEGIALEEDLTGANTLVPCFTPGAMIATPRGPRRVEELRPGDLVLTRDAGAQPIRWIGRRALGLAAMLAAPNLAPVVIRADALGPGRPDRDLVVSPQHRLLLEGFRTELATGRREAFCAAASLANGRAVVPAPPRPVRYLHLMFDAHQVISANGLPCESLLPTAPVLDAFAAASRAELLTLFPELRAAPARGPFALARPALTRTEALCAAFG